MRETKKLGDDGEAIVAQFLKDRGYKILSKNYQTRFGEVDIIAQKNEFIVFVEVKTRKICYFPISTVVTKVKQQKIIKTAKLFFIKNKIIDKVFRFDIATVISDGNGDDHVDYLENAFCENRYY